MDTRQTYLIILTITLVTGTLCAQQMPDSAKTGAASRTPDTTAAGDTIRPAAIVSSDTVRAVGLAADSANKNEPVLLIKSKKDTVIVITDEQSIQKILQNVSSSVKKARAQGYGGAGGFSNRIVALNMNPVLDLVATDSKLAGISFPTLRDGYRLLTLSGGLGYGGLGNGVRIGGGGYGGSCKYVSAPFTGKNGGPDSTMTLKIDLGYGGLLIEKAMVADDWNMYLGSFIGGGAIDIQKSVNAVGKSSAFSEALINSEKGEQATAPFMATEFHGGATYTIAPWLHIGGDFSVLFYYSSSGFGLPASTGFLGVTPGAGFRVIFGNIG